MSTPNPINIYNLDSRYASLSNLNNALAVQSSNKHEGLLAEINKAQTGKWRVVLGGSSKASFDTSPNRVIAEQLKTTYGDAGTATQSFFGLGGSFTNLVSGWVKQACEGPGFGRIRGDSSATADLTFTIYGDTLELAFTQDSDSVACNISATNVSGTTVIGTTPAAGTQQLGIVQTFNLGTVDSWTITLSRPTGSGYVYADYYISSDSTRTGVEVINFTLGGSSLYNMMGNSNTPTAPVVQGNSLGSPNNGLNAWMGIKNVDAYMFAWTFNDSGTDRYYPAGPSNPVNITDNAVTNWIAFYDNLVATIGAIRRPLVYIAELAGHYASTSDSHNGRWNTIYNHVLATETANNWVTILDHNAPLAISNYTTYINRYFTDGGTHEISYALAIELVADCNKLGVPIPTRSSVNDIIHDRLLIPGGKTISASVLGSTVTTQTVGVAADFSTNGLINMIADPTLTNYRVAWGTASGTDAYGSYYNNNYNLYINSGATRVTALVVGDPSTGLVIASGGGAISVISKNGTSLGSAPLAFVGSQTTPVYVTFQISSTGGSGYITLRGGKFYEVHATNTLTPAITTNVAGWTSPKITAIAAKQIQALPAVVNSNFATGDTTGWTVTGSPAITTQVVGANQSVPGGYTLKWTASTGGSATTSTFPVWNSNGPTIAVVQWIPYDRGYQFTAVFNWYDVTNTLISSTTAYSNSAEPGTREASGNGFRQLPIGATPPATASTATITVSYAYAWKLNAIQLIAPGSPAFLNYATSGSAASVSPQTDTGITFPVEGIWDVVVTGNVLNSASVGYARYQVFYQVTGATILASEQIGTTHYSGSVTGLTLSNPTSAGLIQATLTWNSGTTNTATFKYTAKRIN